MNPGMYPDATGHRNTACKPHTTCKAGHYLTGMSNSAAGSCSGCGTNTYQDALGKCHVGPAAPWGRWARIPGPPYPVERRPRRGHLCPCIDRPREL